jgi:hypothetical protein
MAADAPSALLPEETLEMPAARRYPPRATGMACT